MKVFITGGTGFIGKNLSKRLVDQGYFVTVLTRSVPREDRVPSVSYIGGNPFEKGVWQEEIARQDVIINLAGASIFSRWSEQQKKVIRDSRILSTRNIVEAIPEDNNKECVLLNASAVGYYGFSDYTVFNEEAKGGDDFLAQIAKDWEVEALGAVEKGVRVVLCRLGVVLGKNGGAFVKMKPAFKMGLGSPLGSGKQWFPWIHIDDLIAIFLFLIEQKDISGPVNCTAPNPVTNMELSKSLGRALKRPVFMPSVPSFLINNLLGEFGSILLKGQKVVPARLLENNFQFRFQTIDDALIDLVRS